MIKIRFTSGGPKYNNFEMAMLSIGGVSVFTGFYLMLHNYSNEIISMWGIVGVVCSGAGIASRKSRQKN